MQSNNIINIFVIQLEFCGCYLKYVLWKIRTKLETQILVLFVVSFYNYMYVCALQMLKGTSSMAAAINKIIF